MDLYITGKEVGLDILSKCNNIFIITDNMSITNKMLLLAYDNKLNYDLLVNSYNNKILHVIRIYSKGQALENIEKSAEKYKKYSKLQRSSINNLIKDIILLNSSDVRPNVVIDDSVYTTSKAKK